MVDDRTYIKVHDGMPDHPKIEPLSDAAFRLIVTLWCWGGRQHTDGRIKAAAWTKKGKPKVRQELLDAGLVELLPDGDYGIHDYLDWQRSAAEIAEFIATKRRSGTKGIHTRWHVNEGRFDDECKWCVDGDRPPEPPADASQTGWQMPSHMRSQTDSKRDGKHDGKTSPEAEAEAEGTYLSREGHQPNARARPPRRCPKHLNHPDPPNCGACADARREADSWQPPTATPPPMAAHIRSMPPVDPGLAAAARAARQLPAVRSAS